LIRTGPSRGTDSPERLTMKSRPLGDFH